MYNSVVTIHSIYIVNNEWMNEWRRKGRRFGMFRRLNTRDIAILQAIGWYSFQQIGVSLHSWLSMSKEVDQCFRSFDASQNQRLSLWTLSWTRVQLSNVNIGNNTSFGNKDRFWITAHIKHVLKAGSWSVIDQQTSHKHTHFSLIIEEDASLVVHFRSDRIFWSTLSGDRFVSVTCVNQSAPIAITTTTRTITIRATTVLQEGMASTKQVSERASRPATYSIPRWLE